MTGYSYELTKERIRTANVVFDGNKFERMDSADRTQYTARVLQGGKISTASGSKPNSAETLIKKAADNVRYGSPHQVPFTGKTDIAPLALTDPRTYTPKEMINLVGDFVAELCKLDSRLVVGATLSETAADLPWYAAHVGLTAGDTFTVLQGLYGNLLPSANEVANALAEHVAGSIPAFVQMMNARAVELGAYNTRFVNACGLPGDGQFITAYDMSLIMREAVRHDVFVQIINAPYFHFPPIYAFPEGRTIRNTNQLIRPETDFFHPDIIGGKTGWIIVAQNTLSTYSRRRDSGLIVTVLYTERRDDTFLDTVALMDLGFNWMFYGPPEVKPSSEAPAVDFPVIPLPPPDDPLHTPDNPYDTADSPSEDDTDTVGAFPDWCEAQRSNARFPNSPAYTLHLILAVAFSLFVGIVCAIALFPRRKK